MHDVSISARLTTTTTKVGWWSVGDHARCIHLSTVNYNYDEGGMVESLEIVEMDTSCMISTPPGPLVNRAEMDIVSNTPPFPTYDEGRDGGVLDHVRCIHLSTVNYNYDEGGMVECWRSCMMYPYQHG